MRLRTGSIDEVLRAESYADLLLPYALLADQTRKEAVYRDRRFVLDQNAYCTPADTDFCRDITGRARSILNQWRLVRAWNDPAQFPCKPERTFCTQPLRGLGVQAWVRDGAVCSEAVIAFRGTDPSSLSDWTTNLRWFLPLLPIYDQYEQVQDHASRLCRRDRTGSVLRPRNDPDHSDRSFARRRPRAASRLRRAAHSARLRVRPFSCDGVERRPRPTSDERNRTRIADRPHLRAR